MMMLSALLSDRAVINFDASIEAGSEAADAEFTAPAVAVGANPGAEATPASRGPALV